MGPVKLLLDRSRVRRRCKVRIEGGKEPEKEFRSRKSDLRLVRAERSGNGPERELLFKLRTRSWSSRLSESGGKLPRRPKLWRTKRTTRP
ncbi:hypothetical protein F8388_007762 [Cannabis sativa]|uniref:Uncharacterized protein n=1 Tax=Cannabis sativa TaxID=3483 RepID=A0A7J6FT11_CANSA|nr:hypothetical protein G4B88_028602 [Cannabis sativa]KAF4373856.1 hypothetical protein F8388_007762 [Cannabis sativa]KAF4377609.1 hypothetical protein G4B88_006889 [Cannabis sativa]